MTRRPLGTFELAQALTDDHAPFNAVCVLKLAGRLETDALSAALTTLQRRHPMLGVHIVRTGDLRFFDSDTTPSIPLEESGGRSSASHPRHCL